MLSVGLTGGIGSGKSAVSKRLAELGAVVIDADAVAREVVAPETDGLRRVVEEFGEQVLRADGSLDRPVLGAMVFGHPERLHALNAIVHPLVARRTAELVAAAPSGAVVVHDVPLLVENALADNYDVVVVVDAPEDLQLTRLTRLRGMSEPDARARIASQASRQARRAVADVVIENNGTLVELNDAVDRLWGRLVEGELDVAWKDDVE
jgi:dephospho-CoA kinase